MKRKLKQYSLVILLLLSFSLTSISQIYKVEIDETFSDKYGTYTPRDKEPGWVSTSYEANYEGAIQIGRILSKKYHGKKLNKKIAELGGDYYKVSYRTESVTKSYKSPSGSYTQTFGARGDYVQTRTTTTLYSTEYRYIEAYPIYIFRNIPELSVEIFNDGFKDLLKSGCAYCNYSDFAEPEVLKKYLSKGIDINSTDEFGVPYFYYFINCLYMYNAGYSREEYIEKDYKKLEILLEAGLDPNIIPKELKVPDYLKKDDVIPYALNNYYGWGEYKCDDKFPSPLRIIRNKIEFRKRQLEREDKNSEHKYCVAHIEALKKIETLLIKNGARSFCGDMMD